MLPPPTAISEETKRKKGPLKLGFNKCSSTMTERSFGCTHDNTNVNIESKI